MTFWYSFLQGYCAVLKGPGRLSSISGGYGEGETPLPFPNRAVKPLSADGTWPARARESRSPPVSSAQRTALRGGPSVVRPCAPAARPVGAEVALPRARAGVGDAPRVTQAGWSTVVAASGRRRARCYAPRRRRRALGAGARRRSPGDRVLSCASVARSRAQPGAVDIAGSHGISGRPPPPSRRSCRRPDAGPAAAGAYGAPEPSRRSPRRRLPALADTPCRSSPRAQRSLSDRRRASSALSGAGTRRAPRRGGRSRRGDGRGAVARRRRAWRSAAPARPGDRCGRRCQRARAAALARPIAAAGARATPGSRRRSPAQARPASGRVGAAGSAAAGAGARAGRGGSSRKAKALT